MRLLSSCSAFAAMCCGLVATAAAQRTVILAGGVLDPVSGVVTRNQTVVVERGRITEVGARVKQSPGDSVVDLRRFTLMPGMIDGHVHLVIGGAPHAMAMADLRAGFTTVVDLGARTPFVLRLRDSIAAGKIPGPRILAAGLWIGVKGGVCEFNGIGIAGSTEPFRQRVRDNVAAGADVIKACVTSWPAVAYADPSAYEMPDSVLVAIVQEAKALHRPVIAHDISLAGVHAALRAGVTGLAHMAYVDSATARQLRDAGMFMTTTLASLTAGDTSVVSRALYRAAELAYRTGAPLVFGTDGGVLPHGRNAEEFAALVRAGIPLADAIRAATSGAAKAFGLADSIGTIAPHMAADLIAVEGDPLTDVTALTRIRFVMVRGRVEGGS